jgi:uncharacterized protein YggU (UPF0235/DUF167 family)
LPTPFTAAGGGVLVAVRLTPRARRPGVDGIAEGAGGTAVIKAAVAEPPEGGRANAALIALLAREWDLAKSDIALVAGARSRTKTVRLAGDAGRLMAMLGAWAGRRGKDGGKGR